MSNEHTPGPWSVEWKSPCYWLVRYDGVHLPPGDTADDPNRLLIERAPETKKRRDELLWTLEYVRGELSGWTTSLGLTEVLRVIDSVINKATKEEA